MRDKTEILGGLKKIVLSNRTPTCVLDCTKLDLLLNRSGRVQPGGNDKRRRTHHSPWVGPLSSMASLSRKALSKAPSSDGFFWYCLEASTNKLTKNRKAFSSVATCVVILHSLHWSGSLEPGFPGRGIGRENMVSLVIGRGSIGCAQNGYFISMRQTGQVLLLDLSHCRRQTWPNTCPQGRIAGTVSSSSLPSSRSDWLLKVNFDSKQMPQVRLLAHWYRKVILGFLCHRVSTFR